MISWKHFTFVLFLSLLFITNVEAKTYSLQNQSTYVAFYPSTQTQITNWNQLYYLGTSGQSLYQWQFQIEILPTTLDTSVLYPGRYLVEMYIYGVGQFSNLSCDYLSSNFSNINMTTGSWVSNEISSSCVGVYKTTYKGYTAQRILFEFTYKGDNYSSSSAINEIRFYVGSGNGSISSINSGMNYGVNIGNIEDYDSTIVDAFNNDKYQQTQITQNETIINQNTEAEITRKGMWETLKSMLNYINPLSEDFFAYKLVELFLDMLKILFIPEDMDFVTNFVDALEAKLGFIAAIPIKIIEFTLSLATATWEEFNSISLPSISIFGYNFWNAQVIDLTEAINIFKPFKYVTDVLCVVLCARTLNKWREQFTGGGAGK